MEVEGHARLLLKAVRGEEENTIKIHILGELVDSPRLEGKTRRNGTVLVGIVGKFISSDCALLRSKTTTRVCPSTVSV